MLITKTISDLLFPPDIYCLCCGKYTGPGSRYSLCSHCMERMNFKALPLRIEGFDWAAAAMGYGTYERRMIFSLKYDGNTYVAVTAAELIRDAIVHMTIDDISCPLLRADIITEVPISSQRARERGFNQAEKIAAHLGAMCGIKHEKKVLLRIKDTKAQRALSPDERRENMAGAFCAAPDKRAAVQGKRVLLIDDIFTTGATASECGRALQEAGVSELYFAALLNAANRHHQQADSYA